MQPVTFIGFGKRTGVEKPFAQSVSHVSAVQSVGKFGSVQSFETFSPVVCPVNKSFQIADHCIDPLKCFIPDFDDCVLMN